MAIKTSEIRDLPIDELEQRLEETQEELFNLRFQNATGQLDNYSRLRELRKDVARIKTVLREQEFTQSQPTEAEEAR
jgi:large subunit ribosomal protein L29